MQMQQRIWHRTENLSGIYIDLGNPKRRDARAPPQSKLGTQISIIVFSQARHRSRYGQDNGRMVGIYVSFTEQAAVNGNVLAKTQRSKQFVGCNAADTG